MKQIFRKKETLENLKNSPHQHLRKCVENSKENTHTDVRVKSIKKMQILYSKYTKLSLTLDIARTNHKPQTDTISERLHTSLCLQLFYEKKGEKLV